MKALVGSVVFLGVVVLGACGGKIYGDSDGGFPCPVTSAGTMQCDGEGQQCSFPTTVCGSPATEICTCTSGEWSCPPEQTCPSPTCPVSYSPFMTCSVSGQSCHVQFDGCGTSETVNCQCDGTTFQCALPDCPPPPCPPPPTIKDGDPCNAPSNLSCMSSEMTTDCDGGTQPVSCMCQNNTWSCNTTISICDGGVKKNDF